MSGLILDYAELARQPSSSEGLELQVCVTMPGFLVESRIWTRLPVYVVQALSPLTELSPALCLVLF